MLKVLRALKSKSILQTYYGVGALHCPPPRLASPAQQYLDYYRKNGHHFAQVDPLGLFNPNTEHHSIIQWGLRYDQEIEGVGKSFIQEKSKDASSFEQAVRQAYAGQASLEADHLLDEEAREWLYYNFEKSVLEDVTPAERINILQLLVQTQAFDHFLAKKFVTFKRYAGEGAESAIVGLKALFAQLGALGYQQVVMGLPHRGRLNVLTNLLDYPPRLLLRKIYGGKDLPAQLWNYSDDVTSHVSVSCRKVFRGCGCPQKEIGVTVVHNPSHLQAQNPVSQGKCRAKQDGGEKVVNVQVHGDAAFAGQGVVYQSLLINKTRAYGIGGIIHLVVNNQLGYTTYPKDSRSSKYCTDVCKAFDIPVIHVNGDSPVLVHKLMKLAAEFRARFQKDILVDLVCYRKYGHNEVDEPSFTQPKLYERIRVVKSPSVNFMAQMVKDGLAKSEDYERIREKTFGFLEKQFEASKGAGPSLAAIQDEQFKGNRFLTGKWKPMKPTIFGQEAPPTGINIQAAKEYALASVTLRPGFQLHPRLVKFFAQERRKEVQSNKLSWATCEAIAMFSLAAEGVSVRMTGQDVERGTFSQRHATLIDNKTEDQHSPLAEFAQMKGSRVSICNSALTENAVLGFEYGYSLESPQNLVLWEAQFGDFYNTAQVVVDTQLANSESKWLRQSGLVMILPHGYDGGGPQHTSCRLERFLLLANSDGWAQDKHHPNAGKYPPPAGRFYQDFRTANFSVCNPTTPANYFHLLRRQMKRNFRKPLVIAGPKTLLRLGDCTSKLEDLGEGSSFQPVLAYRKSKSGSNKVIVTSGKFVYQILKILRPEQDYTVLALEEVFPFPYAELETHLQGISAPEVYYVQEEAMNAGSYIFAKGRIEGVLGREGVRYVGRRSHCVTAVGSGEQHKREVEALAELIRAI